MSSLNAVLEELQDDPPRGARVKVPVTEDMAWARMFQPAGALWEGIVQEPPGKGSMGVWEPRYLIRFQYHTATIEIRLEREKFTYEPPASHDRLLLILTATEDDALPLLENVVGSAEYAEGAAMINLCSKIRIGMGLPPRDFKDEDALKLAREAVRR